MGSFSVFHWMLVLAIVLIVFGAGRLPNVMGDFAKGIKAFKAGMRDDEKAEDVPPAINQAAPSATVDAQRAANPAGVSDRKVG
jgi:sec-independent protein translocase protein TatA